MNAFTVFHVVLSLVGILAGFVVLCGLIGSRTSAAWTATFLAATITTNVTGFFFPIHGFTPALGLGVLSLVVLAVAVFAFYSMHLAGAGRWLYAASAVVALYFNFFVLIVQSFQKVPALRALAPTQKEPPFAVVQGLALLGFIFLGTMAVRRFHPVARSS